MDQKEHSAGRDLTRRRLIQALGWGGAVFAVSFGVPSRSHAEQPPSCSQTDPDADCGSGYGPTYDFDDHCGAGQNTHQVQSDLGCGTTESDTSIDADGNCTRPHGTPPAVDPDLDCGTSADGAAYEQDSNCGSGYGDPPGTDVDGRCNKPEDQTNSHEDGSCAIRFKSDTWSEMDGNCGFQTTAGIDEDGNCGNAKSSGAADEDGDCGKAAAVATYADASCGMLVGSDKHLDLDGDCGKLSATPPPTNYADNSCGKFTKGGGTLPPRDEDGNCDVPNPQTDPDDMRFPATPPTPANPPPPPQS